MVCVNVMGMLIIMVMGCGDPAPAITTGSTDSEPAATTAEAWLDRTTKRISILKTIRCDLVYERIEGVGIIDSKETRRGTLIYMPGPPARFAIHFDQLIVDRRVQKQSQWYIFDGRWMVDRNDMEKTFTKHQLVSPDVDPAKTNPLALDEGPFKVPFAAKKEQLLKRLTVELMPADAKDPPDSIHLHFYPQPARRMDITRIDVWYDRTLLVPVRAETLDDGPNLEIVTLETIRLDQPVNPKIFDVSPPPKDKGWTVEIKPYVKHRKD